MAERGKKRYAKQYTIPNSEVMVKVGDIVRLKAERGKIPYIAQIHQIYIRCEDVSREVHLKVRWFYRPEDTQMKRVSFNGKNELYKSNHYDYDVPADSILDTCSVRSFKSYTKLPDADENVFFARYTYDHVAKKFEDVDVVVFCYCKEPKNPDQLMVQCQNCKDWYHLACEPKARNLAVGEELKCTKCCEQD